MAGVLDSLLNGAATVGQTALQVPQAVGGGALDILIGDRTNVPAGEQVKRSIEALLLSGDNPANLIAIHGMNAKRDAQNQAIVASPDFKRSLEVNQVTRNLSPMEAFDFTAKQYGVHGYSPDTETQPDLSVGPASPTAPQQERQTVPVLPPSSVDDLLKYETRSYQLGRINTADPTERELALAQAADMSPRLGTQLDAVDRVLGRAARPGETTSTVSVTGKGDVSAKVQTLKGGEQWYADIEHAQSAVDKWNQGAEGLGMSDRLIAIPLESGGAIIKQTTDEEAKSRGTAKGTVIGTAEGKLAPATIAAEEAAARRPTEASRSQAQAAIRDIDATLPLVDTFLTSLRPENVGLVGKLRGMAFGAQGQLDAIMGKDAAGALRTLRAQVQEDALANNLREGDGGVSAGMFDPNLETTEMLGNILAYRNARLLDPSGKLSDADVANSKQSLGLDKTFTSAAQIQQRVKIFRDTLKSQRAAAQKLIGAKESSGGQPESMSPVRAKLLQKYGG